jgi:hypothetical protein
VYPFIFEEHFMSEIEHVDAQVLAISELLDSLCERMLSAAENGEVSAQGVIFAAGAAIKGFYLTAQIVEGWSDEQLKEVVSKVLADAFAFDIKPMVAAPRTH